MTAAALWLLLVLSVLPLGLYRERGPFRHAVLRAVSALVVAPGLLGVVALLGRFADPAGPMVAIVVAVLVVAVSAAAGGPVATALLRLADRTDRPPGGPGPADPAVLHGGAWIGVLERLAVTCALLVGRPEGLAVVLAVKGLGRYPELREPAAAERFIIGTLASLLWAAACAGAGLLLLG